MERYEFKNNIKLDPGYCNNEIGKVPILKPKLLNTWQRERCIEPERNYKMPINSVGYRIRH